MNQELEAYAHSKITRTITKRIQKISFSPK